MKPRFSAVLLLLLMGASPPESTPSPRESSTMRQDKPSTGRRSAAAVCNLAQGLAALTGACLIAGCPGVRALPDGTAACSPQAIAETGYLDIPRDAAFSIELLGQPGSVSGVALLKEGPIEVRVTRPVIRLPPEEVLRSPLCTDLKPPASECGGRHVVSGSALLYGEARFKDNRVYIRLHQLRDGGVIGPFCGVVAQRKSPSQLGLEMNPIDALRRLGVVRAPPGMVAVWSKAEVLLVGDEGQQPR